MKFWANVKKVTLGGMFVGAMMLASSLSVTGCLTNDNKDTTKTDTSHHTALPTGTSVTIGAQGHATYGSAIDIDAGTALTSAQANAAQSTIDLVFLFYGGAFHLEDAVMARASGVANNINLTNSYDVTKIQDVDMVKVTTKPADQEAAKAAFTAGTKIHGSTVAQGDMFLVMSTGGKLALVTMSSITGTDKAAAGSVLLQVNTI
ncbi:MAG: hypothetical protein JF616_17245 [Fibrobacteres bacterium]|nr:hypothetical protein [Fibrobacterota bacterium]